MAEKGDVFPQRNLPGLSENWGRHVEDRIKVLETSETQLEQKVDNAARANAGQLAVLGSQVGELNARSVHTNSYENFLSVTGNNSSIASNSRTISFPRPTFPGVPDDDYTGVRNAILMFSGIAVINNPSQSVQLFMEVEFYDSSVWRNTGVGVGSGVSRPPNWTSGTTVDGNVYLTVPRSEWSPPAFTFRIYQVAFTSTTTTVSIEGFNVSLMYQDPVTGLGVSE